MAGKKVGPTRRRGGAALLLALTLLLIAAPAEAVRRDKITFSQGQPAYYNYPPLPPNDAFFGNTVTPAFCDKAAGCDTIPLTVIEPSSITDDQDYVVRITLRWDPDTRTNLQLYVWDDDGVQRTGDPFETPPRLVASSASEKNPEQVVVYRAAKNYHVVVHNPAGTAPGNVPNPSGPNLSGYELKFEMLIVSFDSPFEALEEESFLPPDTSGEPTTPQGESFLGGPLTPTLELSPLNLDQDFADLAGRARVSNALEGGGGSLRSFVSTRRAPGPVNELMLALSVGVFPLMLVAGGFLWLRQRAASLVVVR